MIQRRLIQQHAARLVVLLCFVAACGASARTKALQVNLVSLNAARDTMLAVSKEREAQIVEHTATKEEGRVQLDAWRQAVDKVAAAIEVGYRAIYAAAILNDVKSASDAAAAAAKALALLKELKPATASSLPKELK